MDQSILCTTNVPPHIDSPFISDYVLLMRKYRSILTENDTIRINYNLQEFDFDIIEKYNLLQRKQAKTLREMTDNQIQEFISSSKAQTTLLRNRMNLSHKRFNDNYVGNPRLHRLASHLSYLKENYFNINPAIDNQIINIYVTSYYGGYEMILNVNSALLPSLEYEYIIKIYIYLYFISLGFSICSYAILDLNQPFYYDFKLLNKNSTIVLHGVPTINMLITRPYFVDKNAALFKDNIKVHIFDIYHTYINLEEVDELAKKISLFYSNWFRLKLACVYYNFYHYRNTTGDSTKSVGDYIENIPPFKHIQTLTISSDIFKLTNPANVRRNNLYELLYIFIDSTMELYSLYYNNISHKIGVSNGHIIQLILPSKSYATLPIPQDPMLGKVIIDVYCVLNGIMPEYYTKTELLNINDIATLTRFQYDSKIFVHGYKIKGSDFYETAHSVTFSFIFSKYERFKTLPLQIESISNPVETPSAQDEIAQLEQTLLNLDQDTIYGTLPSDDITGILLESIIDEYNQNREQQPPPPKKRRVEINLIEEEEEEQEGVEPTRLRQPSQTEPRGNENVIGDIPQNRYDIEYMEGGTTPKFNITDYDSSLNEIYKAYKAIIEVEQANITSFINYIGSVNNSISNANNILMGINPIESQTIISKLRNIYSSITEESTLSGNKSIVNAYKTQLATINSAGDIIKSESIKNGNAIFIRPVFVYINYTFYGKFNGVIIMDVDTFKIEMKFRLIASINSILEIVNMYLIDLQTEGYMPLRYDTLYNQNIIHLVVIVKSV